jgi:hypothetical protein
MNWYSYRGTEGLYAKEKLLIWGEMAGKEVTEL